MFDYLEYKIARKEEAWEGKVPHQAIRRAVAARAYLAGFLLTVAIAVASVLVLALKDEFSGGYFYVSILLFGGFFLLGRAYENALAGADAVVAQYGLSRASRKYFLELNLESFTRKLKQAQAESSPPDPTDPTDLRVPSFERVSAIDFDDDEGKSSPPAKA